MNDYFIVTPARNEMPLLPGLMESVRSQSKRPMFWVIVDDGSTDGTSSFVESAREPMAILRLPFVGQRHSLDAYSSLVSSGIVHGLTKCRELDSQPEFLAVLDADVLLPPTYFESIIKTMASDPKIGIGSGVVYERGKTGLRAQLDWKGHSVLAGAAVVYRLSSLRSAGGYPRTIAPDTVLECKVGMRGWTTAVIQSSPFLHLRPLSSKRRRMISGRHHYYLGFDPVSAFLTSVFFWIKGPDRLSSIAFWVGYAAAALSAFPRSRDPDVQGVYGRRWVKNRRASILRARLTEIPDA